MYNRSPFDKPGQLELHRQTIRLRCRLGSVQAALRDDSFMKGLRDTLVKWGMDSRGLAGHLLPLSEFSFRLRNYEDQLIELEGLDIEDGGLSLQKIGRQLCSLITEMKLSQTKNQIVIGSKALHHILPNLIPPIDREYTRRFFEFWMPQFQYNPDVFQYIWIGFALIARRTHPKQYVGKGAWFTSKTKVLDNAVVGYCKYHDLPKLR